MLMVKLRLMTPVDFETFLAQAVPEYASDNVKSGRWSRDEALARSGKAFAELLPQGGATPQHFLYVMDHETTNQKVGYLWVHVEPEGKRAFLYQIFVLPEHRSKGFGSSAVREVEKILKAKGVEQLALHVFGFNEGAIRLYKRLGFQVTSLNMHRVL